MDLGHSIQCFIFETRLPGIQRETMRQIPFVNFILRQNKNSKSFTISLSNDIMEANEQTLGQLQQILLGVLSPDNKARNETEAYLKSIESTAGFLLVVLQLISILSSSSAAQDCAIRQAASVIFKNAIKRRWAPEDDTEVAISASDRDTLKTHLIDLMCSTPQDVQRQLAEAGSICT